MPPLRSILFGLTIAIVFGSRFSYAVLPSPFFPEPFIFLASLIFVQNQKQLWTYFIYFLSRKKYFLYSIAVLTLIGTLRGHPLDDIFKDLRCILDFFLYLSFLQALQLLFGNSNSQKLFLLSNLCFSVLLGFLSIPLFPDLTALQGQNSIRVILPFQLLLAIGGWMYMYQLPRSLFFRSICFIFLNFIALLIYSQGLFRQSLFVIPFILLLHFADLFRSRSFWIIYIELAILVPFLAFSALRSFDIAVIVQNFRLYGGLGGGIWNEDKHISFLLDRLTYFDVASESERTGLLVSLSNSFHAYNLLPLGLGRDSVRGQVLSLFETYSIRGTEDSLFIYLLIHAGVFLALFLFLITVIPFCRSIQRCPFPSNIAALSFFLFIAILFFVTSELVIVAVQSGAYAMLVFVMLNILSLNKNQVVKIANSNNHSVIVLPP